MLFRINGIVTAILLILHATTANASTADRVTLRGGTTILGQVTSDANARRIDVIVRRGWLRSSYPEIAELSEAREAPLRRRARSERLQRLRDWERDRASDGNPVDPIDAWIDQELERLSKPLDEDLPPLMVISFPKNQVLEIAQRPDDERRMLRQGWIAGFDDLETMSADLLKAGLEDRGLSTRGPNPVSIAHLLPTPLESDQRWLARRASTEVLHDSGLRLIRFGDLVLPDPESGQGMDQALMTNAIGGLLNDLLGGTEKGDPLLPHLQRVESRGKVGAMLTTLEMAPDYRRVSVLATLYVRVGPNRWLPAARRQAVVTEAEIEAGEPQAIANDPQVVSVFEMVDALGLGNLDPGMKQRSLAVGAMTQQAIHEARSQLQGDLQTVEFSLARDH